MWRIWLVVQHHRGVREVTNCLALPSSHHSRVSLQLFRGLVVKSMSSMKVVCIGKHG